MQVKIIDSDYSWKNITLSEYLKEGNIPSGWSEYFNQPQIQQQIHEISKFISKREGIVYPPINQVFRAFYMVKPDKIKAIIIGQDPYPNGSAVGLCFSVKHGNTINPSLRNIYKELKNEGFDVKEDGDLTHWAKQGVLMLNMSLTVDHGAPESHSDEWYVFSKNLIIELGNKPGIKWLLFGKDAQSIKKYISSGEVLCTSHPSPLAATKKCGTSPPFLGSGIFRNVQEINW